MGLNLVRSAVQPSVELSRALAPEEKSLADDIARLTMAVAAGKPTGPAVAALAKSATELVALADLLGRRRTWVAAENMAGGPLALLARQFPLSAVVFEEAVKDMARRRPQLVSLAPGQSMAEAMGAIYADAGFAIAGLAEETVVARVQSVIAQALRSGQETPRTAEIISELTGFPQAYSTNIVRTNANTAYTNGIFEAMNNPNVSRVIGALRFTAVGDADTTHYCRAFDGTIAPHDHPIWDKRSTPAHYQCRSSVDFMSNADLRRMGLMDKDGRVKVVIPNPRVQAMPGFGRRVAA